MSKGNRRQRAAVAIGTLSTLEYNFFVCKFEYRPHKNPFSHFSQVSPGRQQGGKPTLWGDFDLNPASLVGKHSHFSTIFGRLHTRRPSATLPRRLRSQRMRLVGRACASVEQAGLWRRTARRPGSFWRGAFRIEVGEDLLYHLGVLDAGDDLNRTAAFATGFDVNSERPLQALRPGHVHPVFGGRSITVRRVSVKHTFSGMAVLRCIPAVPIF